jgi:hypothetical protein
MFDTSQHRFDDLRAEIGIEEFDGGGSLQDSIRSAYPH